MRRLLLPSLMATSLLATAGVASSFADTVTFNNSALHPDGTITIGTTVSLPTGVIDAVAHTVPLLGGFAITGSCGTSGGFGCLALTTGNFIGTDSSSPVNDYLYSGIGSSIVIRGAITSGTLNLPANTVLFTGSFDPNTNVILQFDDICQTQPTQCTGSLTGTLAPGTLNAALAAAMGVSATTTGGNDQNLFVSFTGITLPPPGSSPTGTGQGNTNQLQVITPAVTAVPEPGSLLLLGSGLIIAARMARRRFF